jgi:hypothetical protein
VVVISSKVEIMVDTVVDVTTLLFCGVRTEQSIMLRIDSSRFCNNDKQNGQIVLCSVNANVEEAVE